MKFSEQEIYLKMNDYLGAPGQKKSSMEDVSLKLVEAAEIFEQNNLIHLSDKIYRELVTYASDMKRKTVQFMPKIEELLEVGIPNNYVIELLNGNQKVSAEVQETLRDMGKSESDIKSLVSLDRYLDPQQCYNILQHDSFVNKMMGYFNELNNDKSIENNKFASTSLREKEIVKSAKIFYKYAQKREIKNLTKVVCAGVSFELISEAELGNPIALGEINKIVQAEYRDNAKEILLENYIDPSLLSRFSSEGAFNSIWKIIKLPFEKNGYSKYLKTLSPKMAKELTDSLKSSEDEDMDFEDE